MKPPWNAPFPFAIWPMAKSEMTLSSSTETPPEQQKLTLPKNPDEPQSHEATYVGRVGGGAMYHQNQDMFAHPLGLYQQNGTQWFVKGATDAPQLSDESHAEAMKGAQGGLRFGHGSHNAAARNEFTAHQLYGVFATPRNGIGKVPAKLMSAETGEEIPDDYHAKGESDPYHAMYVASAKVGEQHMPRYIDDYSNDGDPVEHFQTQAAGGMVDALLGLQDRHENNFRVGNPEHWANQKVYRIDPGWSLGRVDGQEQMPRHGLGIPEEVEQSTLLPDVADIFKEAFLWHHISPDDALDHAQEVIDTWDTKQPEILHALRHAPRKETLYKQLGARVEAIRNMVAKYKDDPDQFADDIESLGK